MMWDSPDVEGVGPAGSEWAYPIVQAVVGTHKLHAAAVGCPNVGPGVGVVAVQRLNGSRGRQTGCGKEQGQRREQPESNRSAYAGERQGL